MNLYDLLNTMALYYNYFKNESLCCLDVTWAAHYHSIAIFNHFLSFYIFNFCYIDLISLDTFMTRFLYELTLCFYLVFI